MWRAVRVRISKRPGAAQLCGGSTKKKNRKRDVVWGAPDRYCRQCVRLFGPTNPKFDVWYVNANLGARSAYVLKIIFFCPHSPILDPSAAHDQETRFEVPFRRFEICGTDARWARSGRSHWRSSRTFNSLKVTNVTPMLRIKRRISSTYSNPGTVNVAREQKYAFWVHLVGQSGTKTGGGGGAIMVGLNLKAEC